MDIILFIIIFYISFLVLGYLLEKISIPQIYAALFLGVLLSTNPEVVEITSSTPISLFSSLGMFLLLFLIGFSLNLSEIKKQRKLITRIIFWVIFSETIFGTVFLHFVFDISWFLSVIISMSFATVGETALLPILRKFNLVKTKLGQTIIGVGVLDDIIEISVFTIAILYISGFQLTEILVETKPLLAIFLGLITNILLRTKKISWLPKLVDKLTFIIFGPFFFFYAGIETNLSILLNRFSLILLLTLLIKGVKISSTFFSSRKYLGDKKSVILGISLCIKFSTSIILLIILLQKSLISDEVFSVLVGVKILFKFIVPILMAHLLNRWKLEFEYLENQDS